MGSAPTNIFTYVLPSAPDVTDAFVTLPGYNLVPGVDKIIVRSVRFLLQHKDIYVRAPALRLTILYGGPESNGSLDGMTATEAGVNANFPGLASPTGFGLLPD